VPANGAPALLHKAIDQMDNGAFEISINKIASNMDDP